MKRFDFELTGYGQLILTAETPQDFIQLQDHERGYVVTDDDGFYISEPIADFETAKTAAAEIAGEFFMNPEILAETLDADGPIYWTETDPTPPIQLVK